MKNVLWRIFGFLPVLEVLMRNLYGRLDFMQNLAVAIPKARNDAHITEVDFRGSDLVDALRAMGVVENDVIVVHSSMKQLSKGGLSAIECIELLTKKLCPAGTLVCPVFPLYPNEPQGTERISKDMSDIEFVYNVKKSRPWTGELGRVLLGLPGAKRSLHPLNTIVALGAALEQIFHKESIDNLDLPCGPNSTWAALYNLNAKIIMLGVDVAHSLTMIHVAEDCFEEEWPVDNWYRKRIFKVIENDNESSVNVRERHPRWAMSYAERKLNRDLISHGITRNIKVGSLDVSLLESKELIEFLNSKKKSAYPYYYTWLSGL